MQFWMMLPGCRYLKNKNLNHNLHMTYINGFRDYILLHCLYWLTKDTPSTSLTAFLWFSFLNFFSRSWSMWFLMIPNIFSSYYSEFPMDLQNWVPSHKTLLPLTTSQTFFLLAPRASLPNTLSCSFTQPGLLGIWQHTLGLKHTRDSAQLVCDQIKSSPAGLPVLLYAKC